MINELHNGNNRLMVVLPTKQDKTELESLSNGEGLELVYVEDGNWEAFGESPREFNAVELCEKCIETARLHHVKGVFYSDDLGNFIASVVAHNRKLPGPSMNSMLLANHKFYSREAERKPIAYSGYEIERHGWKENLSYPVHVKPVSLSFSLLQKTVYSEKELDAFVDVLRVNIPKWERPFHELFSKYANLNRYPLANKAMFLAEEFVSASSQHAVEGFTDAGGNSYIWAVSDNNYESGPGSALDNNAVPSSLSVHMQEKICGLAIDTIGLSGLRNGFWNVEIWVLPDGNVFVTEVNGRICASMTCLYKYVFGKTQYPLAVKLALGKPVNVEKEIPSQPQCVGAMFAISTSKPGIVKDLIDLDELARISGETGIVRTRLIYPEDTAINWFQTGGKCCIARVYIVGSSYEEICDRANGIREKVLKK